MSNGFSFGFTDLSRFSKSVLHGAAERLNDGDSPVRGQSPRRGVGLRCLILVCFVCACLFSAAAPAQADPWKVSNWEKLQELINSQTIAGQTHIDLILTNDISNRDQPLIIPAGKKITIDLDGYNIFRMDGVNMEANAVADGHVIEVQGTLTIKDSGSLGRPIPEPGYHGKIMHGANASSGSNESCGGGVYVNGGTFNLEGGMITENYAVQGGGVCLKNRGVFKMTGGTISDNARIGGRELYGGGVYVGTESGFNMTGGRIENNNDHAYGGGVYLASHSTFFISGDAVISDNHTAYGGGGVHVNRYNTDSISVSISCSDSSCPVISGNTAGDSSAADNVYLQYRDGNIKRIITIDSKLAGTGNVGITMDAPDVFTARLGGRGNETADYFFSDDPEYTVVFENNEGKLVKASAVTVINGSAEKPSYAEGETVTITAKDPDEGMKFKQWTSQDVTLTNAAAASTTFTMPGNAVTVTAEFEPVTYSVRFSNPNGGTDAIVQQFTYGEEKELTENGFTRSFTVAYEYNGATGGNSKASDTAEASFSGWAESAGGAKKYDDKEKVKNLSSTDGYVVNLYALWTDAVVTLPSPEKTDHNFGGWYSDSGLSTKAGDAGEAYQPEQNVILYAKWTEKEQVQTPAFSPEGKTYPEAQEVTISCGTEGAVIYYTTDGSDPTKGGTPYKGPFTVSETVTIKAAAVSEDMVDSEIAEVTYTIGKPAGTLTVKAPVFDIVSPGYEQPDPKPVPITNTGSSTVTVSLVELGPVTVTKDGEEAPAAFILNKTDGITIAPGTTDTLTYTVQPAAGLDAGTYSADILVYYDAKDPASAELRFTVSTKAQAELTVSVREDDPTVPVYDRPEGTLSETVTYSGKLADGTPWGPAEKAPTEPGTYTVTVICETADTVYTGSAEFTLEKTGPEPEPKPEPDRRLFRLCEDCELPATGFSSLHPTALSEQPKELRYEPVRMRLMLPTLEQDVELVTVPREGNSWAVDWLGENAGILAGSSIPGEGTAVIAAHNTLNDTAYGPFAMLAAMEKGDRIFVADEDGELMSFEVYANELLEPDDLTAIEALAEENALVLVTCENEAIEGGYLNRRAIFAK